MLLVLKPIFFNLKKIKFNSHSKVVFRARLITDWQNSQTQTRVKCTLIIILIKILRSMCFHVMKSSIREKW